MTETPYGYCHCGCGRLAPVPTKTDRCNGRVKGVPMKYVVGHGSRGRRFRKGPDWAEEDRGYETPCRIWQHGLSAAGYGRTTVIGPQRDSRKQQYTHILAWEAVYGLVPEGMELDHLCRQRDCGNPDHLEPVPHIVNTRRGLAGIKSGEQQRAKTHCPKGHPYEGDNLYVDARTGRRHCRECRRESKRQRRAAGAKN